MSSWLAEWLDKPFQPPAFKLHSNFKRMMIFFSIYIIMTLCFAWKYHQLYRESSNNYIVNADVAELYGHNELKDFLKAMSGIVRDLPNDSIFWEDNRELAEQMILADRLNNADKLPKEYGLPYKLKYSDFLVFSALLGNEESIIPSSKKSRRMVLYQTVILMFYTVFFLGFYPAEKTQKTNMGNNRENGIQNKKNINDVSIEELENLKGISRAVAIKINEGKPYASAIDLEAKVEGLGAKGLARLLTDYEI